MATPRKVVKKKQPPKPSRVVKDAEIDKDANTEAIESKDASGSKPKIHAKVVHVLVSIGTEDRKRTHEEFVKDIEERLDFVKYGQKGLHGAVTGGYYILDGKVCLPEDYDPKTGTFKKGATPPVWAGGPRKSNVKALSSREQMEQDKINLSSDAYDRKYQIGKYAPKENKGRVITPAEQQARLEEYKKEKLRKEEAELEEILGDEEAIVEVTSASASRAIKRLKSSKGKKRVVKKAAAPKKVVRRVKK